MRIPLQNFLIACLIVVASSSFSACSKTQSTWQIYQQLESTKEEQTSTEFKIDAHCYEWQESISFRYPILLRNNCKTSKNKVEILNLNILFPDKQNGNIGSLKISPTQNQIAFTLDPNNVGQYGLYIYDLVQTRTLNITNDSVFDIIWLSSGKLAYTTTSGIRATQLYTYNITRGGSPKLIFTNNDPNSSIILKKSSNRTFFDLASWQSDNWFEILPNDDTAQLSPKTNEPSRLSICATDSALYFLQQNANSFGTISSNNIEVSKGTADAAIVDINCTTSTLLAIQRNGYRQWISEVTQANRLLNICPTNGLWCELDKTALLSSTIKTKLIEPSLPYVSTIKFAQSKDGTLIPITILSKHRMSLAPTLLTAYGAYGKVIEPKLTPALKLMLNKGWNYAIAHIRGGGELGEYWHHAGQGKRKENSVNDFLAAANLLINDKVTPPQQLFTRARSAGAAITTSALLTEPNLFAGVVLESPLINIKGFLFDNSNSLANQERVEWEDFNLPNLKSLSPSIILPPLLIIASKRDPQIKFGGIVSWSNELKAQIISTKIILRQTNSALHDEQASYNQALWDEAEIIHFFSSLSQGISY